MDKIKVAAYCRVSTSSNDQRNSFKNQQEYFEQVARESKEYEIVEIYADEGISAVSTKRRQQFLRMLYDAGIDVKVDGTDFMYKTTNTRKAKFQKILIKDISRFSRNLDTILLFRALCRKGVSLVGTNMGREYQSQDDEMELSLLLTFAQTESVDRAKKVRFGLKRSAEEGRVKMNSVLYGYNYDPETKAVTIKESEARVVRTVFDLYVNHNLGVRRIVKYLKENKITTKRGKDFGFSSIRRMLENRKYCGDLVFFKYTAGTVLNKHNSNKTRPEEDWIIHEDKIPAIISREMFKQAELLKKGRSEELNLPKGRSFPMTDYAKIIYCKNCGAHYGRNRANGQYFMNCMTKKTFGVSGCDYPNFKVEDLEKIIKKLGQSILYNSILHRANDKIKTLNELKDQLRSKVNEEIPAEYHEYKEKLIEFERQKEKLLDLYLTGQFEKSSLDSRVSKIDEEVSEINSILFDMAKPIEEIEKQISDIDQNIYELSDLKIKKVYSSKEVLSLIDRIEVEHVYRDIKLKVTLKVAETINKVLETLNLSVDENEDLLSPEFIFSIETARNVKTRIPTEQV